MTKPFEGARLLILVLLAIVGLASACTPPPSLIPPMCETPTGPVPCGVQKP